MRVGPKQTIFTGTIPATTPAGIGWVTGCLGAKAILFRFSGGSNASNALTAFQAKCYADASGTPAVLTGGLALEAMGALPKTNGVAALSPNLLLMGCGAIGGISGAAVSLPIPTDAVYISAAMVVALSNTVVVEAWPIFDFDPAGGRPVGGSLDALA